jgi:AcrR family transcriptional regulator
MSAGCDDTIGATRQPKCAGAGFVSKADVASERKDQIVRATVECVTKYGYHNFSMQDVARVAGVSKGIIHYYFLNKDELMMSVLDKVAADIERVLAADMQSIDDPRKKMEIFVNVCFDVVRSTREYYQVSMDFWTQINQKPEVKKVIAQHYSKFRDTCANVIRAGIDRGSFKKVDALAYSSLIIAMIDGISLQWLFDEEVFNYDNIVRTACAEILDGLTP